LKSTVPRPHSTSCRAPHAIVATLLPSAAGHGYVTAFVIKVVMDQKNATERDGCPHIRYRPVRGARTVSHNSFLNRGLTALLASNLHDRASHNWNLGSLIEFYWRNHVGEYVSFSHSQFSYFSEASPLVTTNAGPPMTRVGVEDTSTCDKFNDPFPPTMFKIKIKNQPDRQ